MLFFGGSQNRNKGGKRKRRRRKKNDRREICCPDRSTHTHTLMQSDPMARKCKCYTLHTTSFLSFSICCCCFFYALRLMLAAPPPISFPSKREGCRISFFSLSIMPTKKKKSIGLLTASLVTAL